MGEIQDIICGNDHATRVAQLLDPDFIRDFDQLSDIVKNAENAKVDLFFFGGSLITSLQPFDILKALKEITQIPVVLFPSSPAHIHPQADAILFLSLISGRNPEYLIGHHVAAAPLLRNLPMEIIPTGYMLVDCGNATTAQYISHTMPLPYHKPEVAAATALAGKMMGMKLMYLDGGSGAEKIVDPEMVRMVKEWSQLPVIAGGGIKTPNDAERLIQAGADILVIGNGAQKRPELLLEVKEIMK